MKLAIHFLPHILQYPHQRDQLACFQDWMHICMFGKMKIKSLGNNQKHTNSLMMQMNDKRNK